jgi:hypothetical protein
VSRRARVFLGIAVCLFLVGVATLSFSLRYYFREQDDLMRETRYPSPDAALRAVATPRYPNACRIEYTIEPRDIVWDIRLGSVQVWGRKDGRCDYPPDTRGVWFSDGGWWFIRVDGGWVYLPLERYPHVFTLGRLTWGLLSGRTR